MTVQTGPVWRGAILLVLAVGLICTALLTTSSAQEDDPAPVIIGVFGDSLGDGLWAGLHRHFRRDNAVADIVQLSEVSTGLTNYTYVDVAAKTREQLSEQHIDVAVVMFGTNDIQGIVSGGQVHRFRSLGWQQVYRARIDELVGILRESGAQVYWVGLPRMQSDRYDGNVQFLNSLFAERMAALGVPYIDTRSVTAAADGTYSAYLPDSGGTERLIRAEDGIHFTMRGYRLMAAPLVDRLRADWAGHDGSELAQVDPPPAEQAIVPRVLTLADINAALSIVIEGQPYVCYPETAEAQDLSEPAP